MSQHRRDSKNARRICWSTHIKHDDRYGDHFICNICKGVIRPHVEEWRADHWPVAFSLGGRDTADNLVPVHSRCDAGAGKKAADDTRTAAKVKRTRDKHLGISTKGGFRKPNGLKFNWREGKYERADD